MRIWRWIGGLTGFVGLVGIGFGVVVGKRIRPLYFSPTKDQMGNAG